MVWVNLLPWRQAEQQKCWRVWRFNGGVLLLLILMLVLKGGALHRLNQQQAITLSLSAAALKEAVTLSDRVQAAVQHVGVLQRQHDLQERRQQQMMLWRDFTVALGAGFPANAWLTALHKTRQHLVLRGVGDSLQELHQLRDRLRLTTLFEQVILGPVKRVNSGAMTFEIEAVPKSSAGGGG